MNLGVYIIFKSSNSVIDLQLAVVYRVENYETLNGNKITKKAIFQIYM